MDKARRDALTADGYTEVAWNRIRKTTCMKRTMKDGAEFYTNDDGSLLFYTAPAQAYDLPEETFGPVTIQWGRESAIDLAETQVEQTAMGVGL